MSSADPDSRKPPNVVVLVLDTARARNLSCYGHETVTTEHVDGLAEEGVLFEHATSVSPWTLPSHASLFTGVPPSVHRTNSLESSLPESLVTLATTLSDAGYRTVGVSANPWLSSQFGVTRGFDEFHYLLGPLATDSYRQFVKHVTDDTEGVLGRATNLLADQSPVEILRNGVTATYRQFVDREDDGGAEAVELGLDVLDGAEPYFLFVNFLEPHLPYDPPEGYLDRVLPEFDQSAVESVNQDGPAYNIRNVEMSPEDFEVLEALYDAELVYVDDCIGELLDAIEANGQREDTLVVVTADHGENIGDHELMSHNYSVNETLLHVPLVLRLPGVFEGGETVERRVSSLDFPATVAAVVRAGGVDSGPFHNQQWGVPLHQESPEERRIIAEYLNPMPPIDRMRERCENPAFDVSVYDRTLRAIYRGRQKLIRASDGSRRLYDVVADPDEARDLAGEKPEVVAELEAELDSAIERYEALSSTQPETAVSRDVEGRLENLGYL